MPHSLIANRKSGAVAAALLLLAGCQPQAEETANNLAAPANAAEPDKQFSLPRPAAPLSREQLLMAVVRAQSAHALGEDDRTVQSELDGDRFELRIRFGCGEAPVEPVPGNLQVSRDEEARRFDVSAAPDVNLEDPVVAALAGETVEAVEGFWVPRSWLLRPGCAPAPAVAPPAAEAAPEEEEAKAKGAVRARTGSRTAAREPIVPTPAAAPAGPVPAASVIPRVGIAQFFTENDSRLQRRNERAYSAVVRASETEPAGTQGYDLVLTGRLRADADGRVIRCASPDAARAPVCLLGAEFDRVAIEDVERTRVLAQWERG
jgi:hypothetical protein